MPLWKCHKTVHADKIISIDVNDGGSAQLHLQNGNCVAVSEKYMDKHSPYRTGYYVVYEDGYESFSPHEAFEAGYTKIEE